MEYRIKSEIGRGGFGIVELGRADNGCDYALKKLNIEAFSPNEIPVLTKRFKREVRYQNQINHPNVVEVIEYRLNEEPPWFVMPLARCIVRPNVQITSSERLHKQTFILLGQFCMISFMEVLGYLIPYYRFLVR